MKSTDSVHVENPDIGMSSVSNDIPSPPSQCTESHNKKSGLVAENIKCIVILLGTPIVLFIAFNIALLFHITVVRPDCDHRMVICSLADSMGRDDCFSLVQSSCSLSARPPPTKAQMIEDGYATEEHFICLRQQWNRKRCWMPRWGERLAAKYQAYRVGENFYYGVKDCRNIEVPPGTPPASPDDLTNYPYRRNVSSETEP